MKKNLVSATALILSNCFSTITPSGSESIVRSYALLLLKLCSLLLLCSLYKTMCHQIIAAMIKRIWKLGHNYNAPSINCGSDIALILSPYAFPNSAVRVRIHNRETMPHRFQNCVFPFHFAHYTPNNCIYAQMH